MELDTSIKPFTKSELVSHVEVASVNFDQWVLTIALRIHSKPDQKVEGMVHVIFEEVEGFRLLDEGAMINFPWKTLSLKNGGFVHRVADNGWLN